jgi:protein required for attachment to host cells
MSRDRRFCADAGTPVGQGTRGGDRASKHEEHTMKADWILIANASTARCFEKAGDGKLVLLDSFAHPDSRKPGSTLGSGRPGHIEGVGHGLGSASYQPRVDPKSWEHEKFAKELAAYLNTAVAAHKFERVFVIASNPFLGQIKSHLDVQAVKRLAGGIAADLTSYEGRELKARVDEALAV